MKVLNYFLPLCSVTAMLFTPTHLTIDVKNDKLVWLKCSLKKKGKTNMPVFTEKKTLLLLM